MFRQLNSELKEIVQNVLREGPSRIDDDLKSLRDWWTKQPHFNFEIEDDQLLLSFLRCSKFSLERTKENIDNYFTMRTLAAEIFTNRDPFLPEIQTVLNAGVVLPLPKPAKGCRIMMYTYSKNLNPDTMPVVNICKVVSMLHEILIREDDYAVIGGVKNWTNCKDLAGKYIMLLDPVLLKKLAYVSEKGFPFRVKGIYVTNCPAIFETLFNLAKVFLSRKISERICVVSETNFTELHDHIDQSLLPEEFGGKNGSIKELTQTWKKKIESYRDWFLENEKLRSNESLRMEPSKAVLNMLDMNGSFRQLHID